MVFALISHPDCLLHEMGKAHPESPARLLAINEQLRISGIDRKLRHFESPLATVEQLCRVHTPDYVNSILSVKPEKGELVWLDADTAMNSFTSSAALRAAGAIIHAVDMVMRNEITGAFCNVRPPGHHAEPSQAMGFCFFNNIAIGAAHALSQWSLQRVAIVDFDVHHGNGTEQMFEKETRVLYCSSFQHPLYPYSNLKGSDRIIKMPLSAGSGSKDFRAVYEKLCLNQLMSFKPQLILVSAGFDAHEQDELAQLQLLESDYGWIGQQIKAVADDIDGCRIISTLEGGYALPALGRSVVAYIQSILGP